MKINLPQFLGLRSARHKELIESRSSLQTLIAQHYHIKMLIDYLHKYGAQMSNDTLSCIDVDKITATESTMFTTLSSTWEEYEGRRLKFKKKYPKHYLGDLELHKSQLEYVKQVLGLKN